MRKTLNLHLITISIAFREKMGGARKHRTCTYDPTYKRSGADSVKYGTVWFAGLGVLPRYYC